MATRCAIGQADANGKWKIIYCHNDGYPEGVGAVLKAFWQDRDLAKELISLGSISILGTSIENTLFYIRDRGESAWENSAVECKDQSEVFKRAGQQWNCDYVYLQRDDNSWEMISDF